MKIVTFYTPEYKEIAQGLITSCNRLNYELYCEGVENLGSWHKNTSQKAHVVFKHLMYGEPFLYTDADSVICGELDFSIFDNCDMAARIYKAYGRNELLGGTMFFRPTASVFKVVADWASKTVDERQNEQTHLQNALKSHVNSLRFNDMDKRYCVIFDEKNKPENTLIEHFQASRKMRGIIG